MHFDISSSNHRKRTRQQTHPTLSLGEEENLLEGANVNTVENAQPIRNGATNSAFTTPEDCRDVGASVSDQRKRTREYTKSISVAYEDAPPKRLRKSTAIVGNGRPHSVTFGSGEGYSSSHHGVDG